MRKTVLLDIVYQVNYKIIKSQRSESWILFSSSVKKGGKGQKTYLLASPDELASDLYHISEMENLLPFKCIC
jgi:hypothetical protein